MKDKIERHPNNIVRVMNSAGYSFSDMLPAYPGKDINYIDTLLRDCSFALRRPVISYSLLGIYPCQTRYFNISRDGFRSNGEKQPWPPSKERINILFFGGSTTVGFNIEDSQTIPAVLSRKLNEKGQKRRVEVYNFGSGNYTSRHELLRALDLLEKDLLVDYAIFLDGHNDCYNILDNKELIYVLNNLYWKEKNRREYSYIRSLIDFAIDSYRERKKYLPSTQNYKPEYDSAEVNQHLCDNNIRKILDECSNELSIKEMDKFFINLSLKAWKNYLLSVEMIKTLCRQKGIKPIFIWQPIPLFKTDKRHRIMERLFFVFRYGAFGYFIYNWLNQSHYPQMLDSEDFINLCHLGEGLNEVLYIDICHYSPFFCEVIADSLAIKLGTII